MQHNVTYIDDLLDLDDPVQKGAFNKVAHKDSIKTLPDFESHSPHGKLIESYTDENTPFAIPSQGHSGQRMQQGMTPPQQQDRGHDDRHRPPGMGQPGMGQPGMGHPGMGHPGMGHPGMGHPGMGQPGMGHPGMGQPGMGHPGMGQPGMRGMGSAAPNQKMEKYTPKGILKSQPRIVEHLKSDHSHHADDMSCRDIADHIANCPICSKIYRRKNLVYIIIIILLVIINLIFLQRIVSK